MEPLVAHRKQITSRSVRMGKYAHSVSGGAGGRGIATSSVSAYGVCRDPIRPSYGDSFLSSHSAYAGGTYDYQMELSGNTSGSLAIGNEKITMQDLNDRLASYLETVRSLEKANSKLDIQIREAIEKRGPLEGRDYSKYEVVIADLRAKILDVTMDNAKLWNCLDIARLAGDDFKHKFEYEMIMRQTVEADIAKLRKLLDDTNVIRMHLESDIESLKEELITLKKNHEIDVVELRAQISQVGIRVDVDAPKGQDLARIMEEMRAKYEKIALKNQEDLKAWHESQITEVQIQVDDNTEALKEATTVKTETSRRYQALEIELQSALSLKASFEATLRDIEMRHNLELESNNSIILRLKEELSQIRADVQQNSSEYEHLLNIKVKLEAEIAEYRRLLDGGDLRLEDAVDHQTVVQTKVVTVTQTLVDGKVVSESKDVKSSEEVKK